MRGTLLYFNEAKNSGFLVAEDGERLPVDGSAFPDGKDVAGRCNGVAVTFVVAEGEEGRCAADVSIVPYVVPRRARARHSGRS